MVWAADTTPHISRSAFSSPNGYWFDCVALFLSLPFCEQLLEENRWYNFDDSHISHINEDDVKSGAAYVLFYRRKSDDASGNTK